MPDYLITNCTVKDGAEMARNNMSAFWGDPNWRYVWKHSTLPRVIEVATPRMPNNLLKNQEALRHFKAVDPETGRLLGYIRWMLPENHYYYDNDNDDKDRMEPVEGGLVPHDVTRRSPVWPEGQIPAVSDEERAEIAAGAAAVLWDPNVTNTDDRLDDILGVIKDRLMSKKEYLLVDYLAVHPENQGKGVGTALLKHGIQKAEELGLDIFVLAFISGFKVYKNVGFKVLDSIVQDATRFGGNDNYAVELMEYVVNKS